MAIYHLSAKVISRGAGRSVVAAAAYRSASRLPDERTGVSHDFTAKVGVVHAEVLLPEGAPAAWGDRSMLWNAVEAGERRKDAQLAREVEFALPRELSPSEGVALAQDFVRQHFVSRGMVADLCVHAPVGKDGEAKPHAHVLLTLRRAGPEGFGLKERGWNQTALLREWREGWAELANARLAELGHDARIDHRSLAAQGIGLEPQHKVGQAGMRRAARGEAAERRAEHDAIAWRNGERLLAEPERALEILTRAQSTFTRHDLARLVGRHTDGAEQFGQVLAVVEASPELVRLGRDGRGQERLTTRAMLETERRLERDALALAGMAGHRVGMSGKRAATLEARRAGIALSGEQETAISRVLEARDLVAVVGTAGAGKSTLLASARAAWEREGLTVQGAALSGIAAENLETGSAIPSRTIASLEHSWERGRDALTSQDVLVLDEAGLVGSRQLGRVLAHAREAGAKVVLVGDAEQLQAIEAGAAFRAVVERVGAAEVTEVRRQREDWQREATGELAKGRTALALERYEAAGMVRGHDTAEEARAALVAGWMEARQGRGTEPGGGVSGDLSTATSQVMLAHMRADVADLNARARTALREAGTLAGEDHRLETARGPQDFAVGERVMFLRNERSLGVKNGTLGTLVRIEGVAADGSDARLAVRLDGREGVGTGREVAFQLRDYAELALGYATTVHKAQGVTVDRAHVLATPGMDRHMAYVALTRHRDGVSVHWSREEHVSREHLVRALSRERAKDTALDYGPAEDRVSIRPTAEQAQARAAAGYAERRGLHPLAPASGIVVARPEMARQGGSAPGRGEEHPRPLLAAHHSPDGRDSLGRGATPPEVAAAVGRDPAVLQEVQDRGRWLALAYRDPVAAEKELAALVRAEGGDLRAASRRLREAGPEALGPLRGRDGLFAGSAAKEERVAALEAGRAVPGSLAQGARARERAEAAYVAVVEAQRGRDAVEVPGLSRAAWAAVEAVERARGQDQRQRDGAGLGGARDYWAGVSEAGAGSAAFAEAWRREVLARPEVAQELRAVAEAAERRLGREGAQEAGRGAGNIPASDGPGRREGLDGVGRVVSVSRGGPLAVDAQERVRARQQEAERHRLGIRRGQSMGM